PGPTDDCAPAGAIATCGRVGNAQGTGNPSMQGGPATSPVGPEMSPRSRESNSSWSRAWTMPDAAVAHLPLSAMLALRSTSTRTASLAAASEPGHEIAARRDNERRALFIAASAEGVDPPAAGS